MLSPIGSEQLPLFREGMHSIASLSTGAEQVPLRGPRDYPLPAGQGTACQRHVRKAYIRRIAYRSSDTRSEGLRRLSCVIYPAGSCRGGEGRPAVLDSLSLVSHMSVQNSAMRGGPVITVCRYT